VKKLIAAAVLLSASLLGCTGDVETTDDSTRLEMEVPKVEIGEEDVDLDPATDDDIDVKTP
jgi:hypothetical protein